MIYLGTKEFAEKHNITPGRVRQLLAEGRIYPAHKVGSVWLLYGNSVIVAPHDRHGGTTITGYKRDESAPRKGDRTVSCVAFTVLC